MSDGMWESVPGGLQNLRLEPSEDVGAVAEALEEAAGGDVHRFLAWADEEAQAIRAERVVLAQDEEVEKQRHTKRMEALKAREAALDARLANLARGARLHKAALCPGKKQSRELPCGLVLAFRRHGDRLKVVDKAALKAWALAQPERVTRAVLRTSTSYDVSMTGLEEWHGQSGQLPPGVVEEKAGEDFDVKEGK